MHWIKFKRGAIEMTRGRFFEGRAQSVIEYSLLIAIVVVAFIAMQLYVQRAARATLKVLEDQINAEPQ